jgi:hypothetical protein
MRALPFLLLFATFPAHAGGTDFVAQAKVVYRVGACGSQDAIPEGIQKKAVDAHCKKHAAAVAKYKKGWLDKATPFFAKIVPSGLPDKVVYPFGGHDLITALAVFPDATEFTTISLEGVGDPRAVDTLRGKAWNTSYAQTERIVLRLLTAAFSATTELNEGANTALPGAVFYAMTALAVHGYEPVSLRYFRVEADGSLHYLDDSDLAKHDEIVKEQKKNTKKKGLRSVSQDTFNNMELSFRRAGDARAPVKVYRHIAANLANTAFTAESGLMKHLQGKGKITAITKAASHLLWYDTFSNMRDYLLANMAWMISDATGIPPEFAEKAGFVQETWGMYQGSYMEKFGHHNPKAEKQFVKLWKANEKRDMPIKFGYFDKGFRNNLLVTRPK